MNFPRFVSLLSRRALFFARPDALGDPFEGSFPVRNLDPTYEAVGEVGVHVAHGVGEKGRLTAKFHDGVRSLRPKTLINCWYGSKFESAAMWGLYARDEGAVCVKSTVHRLVRALHRESAQREVFVGTVWYIDWGSQSIPMTNLLHAFWTKRICFERGSGCGWGAGEAPPTEIALGEETPELNSLH